MSASAEWREKWYREGKHGTITGYRAVGCRCDECCKANTEHQRKYYQRRREEGRPVPGTKPKAAHAMLNAAIELGIVVRPETCERCFKKPGKMANGHAGIQGHHKDYSLPLDVEWLCVRCHKGAHAIERQYKLVLK